MFNRIRAYHAHFRPGPLIEPMTAITASRIGPSLPDCMIQTIPVVRAKHIPLSPSLQGFACAIHKSPICFKTHLSILFFPWSRLSIGRSLIFPREFPENREKVPGISFQPDGSIPGSLRLGQGLRQGSEVLPASIWKETPGRRCLDCHQGKSRPYHC